MKKSKVIEKFKDGVVDGLIHGIRDTTQNLITIIKKGYDFGITLYSRQIDEENKKEVDKNAQTS